MAAKDYYAILGVKRNATDKEIKQAYRRLARKYHPDVNPGDKAAEARFKEINEAYEVLSSPDNRKKYDEYGENWRYADQLAQARQQAGSRGNTWSGGVGGFDLGDVGGFGSIFDNLFRGGRTGTTFRSTRTRRGEDVEYPIEVSLEEAYQGTARVIETQKEETCPTCGGLGYYQGRPCANCGGLGFSVRPHRLEVRIHAGTKQGSRVRVAGEGRPGVGGGHSGDLYLVVSVRSHDRFERKEDDLYVEVPVPLITAILGGEVEVPTLKGKVALRIPSETQNGQTFRLAGLGMPKLGAGARGELYAKARVVLPTHLSEKEKALFEELKALRK